MKQIKWLPFINIKIARENGNDRIKNRRQNL